MWESVGLLTITSGTINVGDGFSFTSGDGVRLTVPPGRFRFEVERDGRATAARVRRARVRADGVSPDRSRPIGEVPVDAAAIVVADLVRMRQVLGQTELDEFDRLALDGGTGRAWVATLPFGHDSVRYGVCSSGHGDGTCPAMALTKGADDCGLQVEFINDDARP